MIHDLSAAPALALLELGSMARALRVGDSMVKKAPIEVILAEPVSPGKFLILVSGEVACVEESYLEGRAVALARRMDEVEVEAHDWLAVDLEAGREALRQGRGFPTPRAVPFGLICSDLSRALRGRPGPPESCPATAG